MPLTGSELEVPLYVRLTNGTIYRAGITGLSKSTADALYLALTGGTLTGPLVLNADPAVALGASTKQYTDTKWTMWSGTQAAFDAIGTKDPSTLYVIV